MAMAGFISPGGRRLPGLLPGSTWQVTDPSSRGDCGTLAVISSRRSDPLHEVASWLVPVIFVFASTYPGAQRLASRIDKVIIGASSSSGSALVCAAAFRPFALVIELCWYLACRPARDLSFLWSCWFWK